MSTETLNIVITGNNKQLIAAVNQSDVAIDKFVNSATKASSAVNTAGAAVGKNNQKWLEFGRVIQDLPYGFTGIANNLTQIIPAVGGLGLAFSAVVSAITFAQIGFSNWTRGISKAKEETEAFNKELMQQREGSQQEISSMKALVSVVNDVSLSADKRKTAIEKLRDQYPGYFKDLTLENSLNYDLTNSTNELTTALLKRAEARAREVDIAKKAGEVFKNQQRLDEISLELEKERANLIKAPKGSQGTSQAAPGGFVITKESSDFLNQQNKIKDLLKEKDDLLTKNSSLTIQMAQSQNQVNKIASETISLDAKETKGVDEKALAWERWNRELERYLQNEAKISGHQRKQETIVPGIEPVAGPGKANLTDNAFNQIQTEVSDRAAAADKSLRDYNAAAAEALQITNALAQPFTDLANAMLMGQDLGEALGNTFKKLAADIAAAAIKAAIFTTILNVIPGLGTGIKAGTGFLGSFGKFLGFDTGGTAKGPKSGYPVMLHGTESIFRPDQLGSLLSTTMKAGAMSGGSTQPIVLDTRISGNDIYLSQRRTDFFRNLRT